MSGEDSQNILCLSPQPFKFQHSFDVQLRLFKLIQIGKIALSALPARLPTGDTQVNIRMDCKGGNPVSALGVGAAHTLKWPLGLVCLATCIK